jgi:single stranded DNA-binding protein (ssb)
MNSITIAGHLGRDPEERVTPSGQKVVNFSVATNKRKAGKDETTWWRVTVWGENKIVPYLKKGSGVIVIGSLDVRTYDKEGVQQISLDITADTIHFLPSSNRDKPQEGAAPAGTSYGSSARPTSSGQASKPYGSDHNTPSEEEFSLPF